MTSRSLPTARFWCRSLEWGLLPNRWNITPLWFFSCPVLSFFVLPPTPSSNRAANIRALWLIWRGSAQEGPFWGKDDEWHYLGETCPTNPLKTGVNRHFQAKLPNLKIAIFPKPYTRSVQNLMAKLTPSTARRGWSTRAVGPIWNTTWLTSAILKINIAS